MQKSSYKDGISVIVTVFNKEEYIIQTLRSAITQLNVNKYGYQIIVVDDDSTDSSYQISRDFLKENKVDFKIVKQKNSGPSIATNTALKFVKYSFIKILDGDDILAPDSLEYMKSQMEKKFIDLLYGDWTWVKDPANYKFKNNSPESNILEDPINKFIISGWGGASNLMVKTDVMNEIGGCDNKLFVQDFSIPIRVAGNHLKSTTSKRFCVGRSNKIICVGPSNVEQRVMSVNGQTLYDFSLGALNFIDEHKLLENQVRKKVLKKIISRCWSWRKKSMKIKIFNKFFLTYLLSKLNIGLNPNLVRYHVYRTWIEDENIRKINFHDKRNLRILIYVGLDLLGDALLKIPLLKCIKSTFPNSEITWMAGKGKSILSTSLKPLSIGLIDKISDNLRFGSSILDFFKQSSFGAYDIVIDTQKRFLTTLILKTIKTEIFISPCANFLFSDLSPRQTKEKNLSKSLVNISEIFNFKKIEFQLKDSKKNSYKVAICPGASVIWKRWDLENFIEISEHLIRKKLVPVFILGPKEKDIERHLKREFGNKIEIISTNDPMETIKEAKKCRAGITNDTGCGHLLASVGMPLLTLFGPTDHKKFSPIGNPQSISISSQEIFKSKNINAIPTDLVLQKLKKIL